MKDLIRLETFFVVVWDGVWASRASWLCSGPSNEAPFEVGGAIAPETTSNDLKASVRVAWVLPFATAGLHRLAGCVVHVGGTYVVCWQAFGGGPVLCSLRMNI